MQPDTRNVLDEFKGKTHEDIVAALDTRGVTLEIAIENLERDYNMGTIVRSANAFGVRHVHVVGRRQWNKRGAMMTDKYLHVHYYETSDAFVDAMKRSGKQIVAVENNVDSIPLGKANPVDHAVLLFGSEGSGISSELLAKADEVVHIEQLGSTRSLNVGVAAGIAMYEWIHRQVVVK
jgi:tRNA G18 (ribose-2'-O)-methylase SpoU